MSEVCATEDSEAASGAGKDVKRLPKVAKMMEPIEDLGGRTLVKAGELEEDDIEAVTSAVQWGVMGRFKNGTGHCGFPRQAVRQPVVGRRYR